MTSELMTLPERAFHGVVGGQAARLLAAVVAALCSQLLLPGVGHALGPNGGDYSTTATAYANVHTGVTYNWAYAYEATKTSTGS